jgi:hypothetical protein
MCPARALSVGTRAEELVVAVGIDVMSLHPHMRCIGSVRRESGRRRTKENDGRFRHFVRLIACSQDRKAQTTLSGELLVFVHAQAQEEKCVVLELSATPSLQRYRADPPEEQIPPASRAGRRAEASKLSRPRRPSLSRAMTGPAQIPLSSIFGRPPPSISTETKDLGIAGSVKAWALR